MSENKMFIVDVLETFQDNQRMVKRYAVVAATINEAAEKAQKVNEKAKVVSVTLFDGQLIQ